MTSSARRVSPLPDRTGAIAREAALGAPAWWEWWWESGNATRGLRGVALSCGLPLPGCTQACRHLGNRSRSVRCAPEEAVLGRAARPLRRPQKTFGEPGFRCAEASRSGAPPRHPPHRAVEGLRRGAAAARRIEPCRVFRSSGRGVSPAPDGSPGVRRGPLHSPGCRSSSWRRAGCGSCRPCR